MITTAGKLPAKYVIHTVGPVWNGGLDNEASLLADCYRNSLELAAEHQCNSIVFPNISTGVYRFPKEKAAKIALDSVQYFLKEDSRIQKVIFVCFDNENYQLMLQMAGETQ